MIYGYARVSSTDQNLDRQHNSFNSYELKIDKVIDEKGSGKNFKDRPEYLKLRRCLKTGDSIVISSLDRLGRNYTEILNEWRYLTEKKKVDIYVIDMSVLNTKNNVDGLDGRFISNLVLQILAYVSQKERENIVARVKQGMANAKTKGVKIGRPEAEFDVDIFHEVAKEYLDGKITGIQAAEICGLARATFYRKLIKYGYGLKERIRKMTNKKIKDLTQEEIYQICDRFGECGSCSDKCPLYRIQKNRPRLCSILSNGYKPNSKEKAKLEELISLD